MCREPLWCSFPSSLRLGAARFSKTRTRRIQGLQRKRGGGGVFPLLRQRNLIIGCAGDARGVQGAVLGKSYDLSTHIDRARLPVISAERRESSHVAELPKKREAHMVCADAANVFAVR